MKRFLLAILSGILPLLASGQAQITTKKMKLEDFQEKTTKVVLPGNMFLDGLLKEEIKNRWTISPYEFCSVEEFERLKSSTDYYFLLLVKGQFRKESEPGLQMLSLVKGGTGNSIGEMLDVVTLPVCAAENPSGREFTFLPAFIDIIQTHVLASMEKDISAYTGLSNYTLNLSFATDMRIVLSDGDISDRVPSEKVNEIISQDMQVLSQDDADALMDEGAKNTLVSYTVAPYDGRNGSYCYKMLIDCSTHKLYYFRRHRITPRTGSGFLAEDLKRIAER